MLETPVVFLVFNRPDTTAKVFESIRQAKPRQLFVVADGPRLNYPGEAEKCAATRAIVDQGVDWECEVLKDYAEENLGLKWRVSTGLDWVFATVEEAIILEDDCVAHPSFFPFCQELLAKYRHDERVMMINGTNILGTWKADHQSYHFSYFGSCWGWASWRRAWQYYDVEMKLWTDQEAQQRIRDVIVDEQQYRKCWEFFEATYYERANSWAYRWFFARLCQSGLLITPAVNLIANIGFNQEGTNTKKDIKGVGNLPTAEISFPLQHPACVAVDRQYDYLRYQKTWAENWLQRMRKQGRKVKQWLLNFSRKERKN